MVCESMRTNGCTEFGGAGRMSFNKFGCRNPESFAQNESHDYCAGLAVVALPMRCGLGVSVIPPTPPCIILLRH